MLTLWKVQQKHCAFLLPNQFHHFCYIGHFWNFLWIMAGPGDCLDSFWSKNRYSSENRTHAIYVHSLKHNDLVYCVTSPYYLVSKEVISMNHIVRRKCRFLIMWIRSGVKWVIRLKWVIQCVGYVSVWTIINYGKIPTTVSSEEFWLTANNMTRQSPQASNGRITTKFWPGIGVSRL